MKRCIDTASDGGVKHQVIGGVVWLYDAWRPLVDRWRCSSARTDVEFTMRIRRLVTPREGPSTAFGSRLSTREASTKV